MLRTTQIQPLFGCGRLIGSNFVQFFSGLEAYRFARSDADFAAGPGIAADTGFSWSDAKNAKATQLNPVAGCHSLFQSVKDTIHGCLCFDAGQSGTLNHLMNDVLFNQRFCPFLEILQRRKVCIAGVSIFIHAVIVNCDLQPIG